MNSKFNFLIRILLKIVFDLLSFLIRIKLFFEKKSQKSKWLKLKKQLIGPGDIPKGFEFQEKRLMEVAQRRHEKIFLAKTSGTRAIPKIVPYSLKRLRRTQRLFLRSMIILTSRFRSQKTFFVISSLEEDSSLTAALLKEKRPHHWELLQAPYRYLLTQEGQELRHLIGLVTARLALIIVTNPRFIYATNPSTLTHFIDDLKNNWDPIRSNLKILLSHEKTLKQILKLEEGDALKRLTHLSTFDHPEMSHIFPKLVATITWDGGYVTPFTDRLKSLLPSQVEHVPMYSMSTECIETLPHLIREKVHFLPTADDSYPEFFKDGDLFAPWEVRVGETYTLVMSDLNGLIRYDTMDEFLVVDMIEGIPDLRFKRRRNVTASLTGEKITEAQCIHIYQELRSKFSLDHIYLTLFGEGREGKFGYKLGLIGQKTQIDLLSLEAMAQSLLEKINEEYQSKVNSGRLSSMKAQFYTLDEFAKLMGQEDRWESQFKVMPLYEKPLK